MANNIKTITPWLTYWQSLALPRLAIFFLPPSSLPTGCKPLEHSLPHCQCKDLPLLSLLILSLPFIDTPAATVPYMHFQTVIGVAHKKGISGTNLTTYSATTYIEFFLLSEFLSVKLVRLEDRIARTSFVTPNSQLTFQYFCRKRT